MSDALESVRKYAERVGASGSGYGRTAALCLVRDQISAQMGDAEDRAGYAGPDLVAFARDLVATARDAIPAELHQELASILADETQSMGDTALAEALAEPALPAQ